MVRPRTIGLLSIRALLRARAGISGLNYALLLGLTAAIAIGSVTRVGEEVRDLFDTVDEDMTSGLEDRTPAPLVFDDAIALPGATINSEAATVTDINRAVSAAIADGDASAELVINGQGRGRGPATMSEGESLALRQQAGSEGEARTVRVEVGTISASWTLTAGMPLSFTPTLGAVPGAEVTSASVELTGFDQAVTLAVDSQASDNAVSFSIDEADFTDQPVLVQPGQSVRLRTLAGDPAGTTVSAVVTLAGLPTTWSVTSGDFLPDLAFTPITQAPIDYRLGSGPLLADGFDQPVTMTLRTSDGQGTPAVALNGAIAASGDPGASPTEPVTLRPGETVAFWITSSNGANAARDLILDFRPLSAPDGPSAGSVSWPVTTGLPLEITTPDILDAIGETLSQSEAWAPTGFDVVLPITISDDDQTTPTAELQVVGSGEEWGTEAMLPPGGSVLLRMISGPETGEAKTAQVQLGPYSDEWQVIAPDVTIDFTSFPDSFGHAVDDWAVSNAVIVADVTADLLVEGAPDTEVSVDGGAWAASATASPGSLVRARQRIPAAASKGDTFTTSVFFGGQQGRIPVEVSWTAEVGGTDKVPDVGSLSAISPLDDVEPSKPATSVPIVLSGLDAAADLVVTSADPEANPMVSIDGAPLVVADVDSGVTVRPGQPFTVAMTAPPELLTSRTLTVMAGDVGDPASPDDDNLVSGTWTITTRAVDDVPDVGYIMPNLSGARWEEFLESDVLQPIGYTTPIEIQMEPLDGDSYENDPDDTHVKIGDRDWVNSTANASQRMISPGDTFQLRHRAAIADGGIREVRVTVGGAESYIWEIDTIDGCESR